MPRFFPLSGGWNAGEISPRLHARTDFEKYFHGLETCINLIPLAEGGVVRRPGTRYVAEIADSSVAGKIRPFQFSEEEAHPLEFGSGTLRFYFRQGQLVAENITPSISNGTFDSDITGWADQSTGSASIEHAFIGNEAEGTFSAADSGTLDTGDGGANNKNWALKFTNTSAGDVSSVKIDVATVSTSYNAQVGFYTDSGGSPNTQVGGNSDSTNLNSTGEKEFTWSSNTPTLSASTDYWCVVTDVSAGSGQVSVRSAADQGSGFASGRADTIGSISDGSGSTTGDFRIEINLNLSGDGVLALKGASGETAIAEESIAISETDTEHLLKFRVRGEPQDKIKVRIGTASGGEDVVADLEIPPGYYCLSFTPGDVSTVYLQFRNEIVRDIYIDDVSLIDNTAVSLDTPYTESQLPSLKFTQSGDVLYIFHEDVPTHKLVRRSLRGWDLQEVHFEDGPYLAENTTTTTMTPGSASVGTAVSLTASSTDGINSDQGFLSTDVGRLIRLGKSDGAGSWGWGVIVSVTSTTVATMNLIAALANTTATTHWRLGAWSETTGYPGAGAFFEQRLYAAATTDQPQTFWASQTADFENMTPDNRDDTNNNTVEDDDALDFTLSADEVNKIIWLSPGEDTLAIGTAGGEWIPTANGAVITPLDITVRKQTSHGSADIAPVRIGQVVLFVQRAKRKLREFAFRFETDGFVAADMTRLAQHITFGGIEEIAYQQEPESLVWAVRGDGTLLSMTYRREEDVVAWSRHVLGGSFSSGQAVVESVTTIPGFDDDDQVVHSGDRDEVWLIVKRTIDGGTKRYIEVMERGFETGHNIEDAYYVDSLITYDPLNPTTPDANITGLGHLEGETVSIWADATPSGGALPVDDETVSSGFITISGVYFQAQVGLPYTHTLKTLKIEGGNPAGTAVGRVKKISHVTAIVLNTHRFKFDVDDGTSVTKEFRTAEADALKTGETDPLKPEGGWKRDTRITISDNSPAPFELLALVPHIAENPLK